MRDRQREEDHCTDKDHGDEDLRVRILTSALLILSAEGDWAAADC